MDNECILIAYVLGVRIGSSIDEKERKTIEAKARAAVTGAFDQMVSAKYIQRVSFVEDAAGRVAAVGSRFDLQRMLH